MKTTVVILIVLALSYFFFSYTEKRDTNASTQQNIEFEKTTLEKPITVVFYQDLTGSITSNGIEVISSSVFKPYFNAINRNIELNFGCISDNSSRKLITVTLPAKQFTKPILPNFKTFSIVEKKRLQEEYSIALNKYQKDSLQYYTDRTKSISVFSNQVDSVITLHRNKLSSTTDIITALAVADKAFNYSTFRSAKNYLLLNSDGLNTNKKHIAKLNNHVSTILINADSITHTTIDALLPTTVQSVEQAIQLSLNINHN